MTARAVRLALLIPALSAVGCGTAANLVGAGPGAKVPFGGVAHDLAHLRKATSGEAGVGPMWEGESNPRVASAVLCAADLPFSFLGDVVTWPYTRTYTYVNQPTDFHPLVVAPPGSTPTHPFQSLTPPAPPAATLPPIPPPTVGQPKSSP